MKRAVSIAVTAIDSDYGFTLVTVLDSFSGEPLQRLVISSEDVFGPDGNSFQTIVHIERQEIKCGASV